MPSAAEVSDLIYRKNIEHVNGISPLLDRITPKFTAFCRIYACISVQKIALLLLFRFFISLSFNRYDLFPASRTTGISGNVFDARHVSVVHTICSNK